MKGGQVPPLTRMWFHRSRALLWLAIGIVSFPLGWADSVVLVWIASAYANVVSDLGAAEAADDRAVTGPLERIEHALTPRPPLRRAAGDRTLHGGARRALIRRADRRRPD